MTDNYFRARNQRLEEVYMATSDGARRFLSYINERENIRIKKENGAPWPWTKDEILQQYKFTNVHRSDDRTTREFCEIYRKAGALAAKPKKNQPRPAFEVCLMNAATFRYFGTVDWARFVGFQKKWDRKQILAKAQEALKLGMQIFTGAYVITNGGMSAPKEKVVTEYLDVLALHTEPICTAMAKSFKWEDGARVMYKLPGFGGSGFMTKEVLQDFLLMWPGAGLTDRDTWTPVGPGARRGLNRIMGRALDAKQPEEKWLSEITMLRKFVNSEWPKLHSGAPLTAHDVQFCCCEFDKYERVRLGQGRPRSRYVPTVELAAPHLKGGIEIA